MAKEDYIYAVTRIHTHEKWLLNKQDIERLVSAEDVQECVRLLKEKDWDAAADRLNNPEELIEREREKTWALIEELLKQDLDQLDVLRYETDFHNLKAAVKLVYSEQNNGDFSRYFRQYGTVETDTILKAVQQRDFSSLPPSMAKAGQNAFDVLTQTGNGQSCDMIIDCAALLAIEDAGKKSGSDLLRDYAQLTADVCNIKSAVRACRMGKNRGFLERAIASAGTLDTEALIVAAAEDLQAVYDFLLTTAYSEAVPHLQKSTAAFECWCDNRFIRLIRPQRYEYFTIEPIAAFVIGREKELATVQLILSAKINHLSNEALRERMRETYV